MKKPLASRLNGWSDPTPRPVAPLTRQTVMASIPSSAIATQHVPPAIQAPAPARRTLLQAGTLLCLLGVQHLASAQSTRSVAVRNGLDASNAAKGRNGTVAVRVWPAEDYSRITIESDQELKASYKMRKNPAQMQVDVTSLQLSSDLRNVVTKVTADDPNIVTIHIAQYDDETVRLTIDLKKAVTPEVFTLKPVSPYRWRLVLDFYPVKEIDPMAELIAERTQRLALASQPSPLPPLTPPPTTPPPPETDLLGDWINGQPVTAAPPLPSAPATPPITPKPPPLPVPALPPLAPATKPTPATPAATPPPIPAITPPPPVAAPAPAPTPPATRPPAPSTPAPRQTDRIIIVAIDPGHGGEDPGAIGPAGTFEKTVVLAIGLALRDRINRSRINGVPMQAFMTRDRDFFVPLGVRVQKARRVKADLFMSIHADGFTNPNARGAGVYALSQRGASSTTARFLADKENQSDLVGGVNVKSQHQDVQQALVDMSTAAQIRDSLQFGTMLVREMEKFAHMHKKRVEQANFAVLRSPDIPSVLVETAFITNPEEERLLRDRAYQNQMADALLQGILNYFTKFPPSPRARSL
ncbi:N-acetylmuramoyl-L-alanine amidase [Lampropedia hyalina DSM 16112]|uniref:N-acetylmuramoyl-L-alanine amidase AmiC n=1 Tax=Lampropedia hyalina DSM 16112 TaxID=1122156 RepID=A0A1M4WVP6_9BURK|nr:N-acetylmuramoyl-L-alanine amidase [Lampropedia hyalina]SHE85314.1 N-acetylmuramoyl-L-alanine amidase [Lampropedia hyalina DSM 16112]